MAGQAGRHSRARVSTTQLSMKALDQLAKALYEASGNTPFDVWVGLTPDTKRFYRRLARAAHVWCMRSLETEDRPS
jgi:hypothetical protein